MLKKTVFLLAVSILFSVLVAMSIPVYAQDAPYVDVFIPENYDYVNGNNYFVVDASNYYLEYDLSKPSIMGLYIKSSGGLKSVLDNTGTGGVSLQITSNGKGYSSYLSNQRAKFKIVKAGNNVWQIKVENIKLRSSDGLVAPLVAEQTYWFWPEKYYVTTEFKMTSNFSVDFAEIVSYYNANAFNYYNNSGGSNQTIPSGIFVNTVNVNATNGVVLYDSNTNTKKSVTNIFANKTGLQEIVYLKGNYWSTTSKNVAIQRIYSKNAQGGSSTTWLNGNTYKSYYQVFVSDTNSSTAGLNDMNIEIDPLNSSEFFISGSSSGVAAFNGYDNTTGCYEINVPREKDPIYVYDQNYYETAKFTINNDNKARKIRIRTYKRNPDVSTNVAGGAVVMTDGDHNPTGTYVQINKKFDDGGYYWETFCSVDIAANTQKSYWHKEIFGHWGNKISAALSQVDLMSYDPYAQLWLQTSVGISEITCYDHDVPMRPNIDDMRAYNGVPHHPDPSYADNYHWFKNLGGGEFGYYVDGSGAKHKMKRKMGGLRLDRVGPNVAKHTVNLKSDDNKMQGNIQATFFPSTDMSRVFYKVRYDFLQDMSLTDASKNLRLFSLGDVDYPGQYTFRNVAYLASDGSVQNRNINHNANGWDFTNMPISTNKAWVSMYGSNGGNVGFVVRGYNGQINGAALTNLALSMQAYPTGGWDPGNEIPGGRNYLYLVPYSTAGNIIKAGDYIELEIEYCAYGNSTSGYQPMQQERVNFGTSAPTVTVASGTKISDFPSAVQLNSSNYAEFTVTGGKNYIPIEIKGYTSYQNPRLEERINGVWIPVDQSVNEKDFWQTEYDYATGKYNIIYLIKTDGSSRTFRANSTNPLYQYTATKSIDGTIIKDNVPFQVLNNQTVTLNITVFNNGTQAWRGDEPTTPVNTQYGLAGEVFGNAIWIPLAHGDVIQPGQSKTFTINISGYIPQTGGIYNNTWFQFIKQNHGFLGNRVLKEIRVFKVT